jgi:hypothetical protein
MIAMLIVMEKGIYLSYWKGHVLCKENCTGELEVE